MSPPRDSNAGRIDQKTTDVLVKPFTSLCDSESQRQALHGLVRALSGQQIQDLQVLVGQTNVHTDIVGKLPIELLQNVLRNLPLFQLYQVMRVSKEWLRIVGCPLIMQSSVRPWFSTAKTPLRIPEGLSAKAEATIKAEHIDAYRNGRPFSRLIVKRQHVRNFLGSTCWAYAAGIVAWVLPNTTWCRIYRIEDGFVKSWLVDDANSVTQLELSASIIAMVMDSGHCYVWKLTSPYHFIKHDRLSLSTLRPRHVHGLVVSGNSLAVLYEDGDDVTLTDITFWTFGGQAVNLHAKGRQEIANALVSHQSEDVEKKILIDSDSQSVVLFERVAEEMWYTRFSFAAVMMAQGHLTSPYLKSFSSGMASPLSNGCAVIWSDRITQIVPDPETAACTSVTRFTHVVYDLQHARLRLEVSSLEDPMFKDSGLFEGSCFFLKNVMFNQFIYRDRIPIQVIDFDGILSKNAETGKPWNGGHGTSGIRGDEIYLVSMTNAAFCVWCFDKNVTMAGEDKDFKTQMIVARQERLKKARMASLT